jgi:hypothetical protein
MRACACTPPCDRRSCRPPRAGSLRDARASTRLIHAHCRCCWRHGLDLQKCQHARTRRPRNFVEIANRASSTRSSTKQNGSNHNTCRAARRRRLPCPSSGRPPRPPPTRLCCLDAAQPRALPKPTRASTTATCWSSVPAESSAAPARHRPRTRTHTHQARSLARSETHPERGAALVGSWPLYGRRLLPASGAVSAAGRRRSCQRPRTELMTDTRWWNATYTFSALDGSVSGRSAGPSARLTSSQTRCSSAAACSQHKTTPPAAVSRCASVPASPTARVRSVTRHGSRRSAAA